MTTLLTTTPADLRADLRIALAACPLRSTNEAGHVVGEQHHRARLTDHDIDLIFDLRAHGLRYAEIASKFGVSLSTVESVCTCRRRSHTVMGTKATAIRT